MKTKVLFAILILFAMFANGQNNTVLAPEHIGEVKVTPPEFTGFSVSPMGNKDLSLINKYLVENVIYPEKAQQYRRQGTEVVEFTVTSDGKLYDFKIINSISKEIDQEMIRVLETTNGMWKPGYNNNQAVDMTKEVSMVFFIDDQSSKTSDELFTSWATTSYKKGSTALYEKHNVDKALRCFNDGINYLPNDKCLLLLRGICRFEKGDSEGAMEDWNRMNEQGGNIDMSEYADLLKDMKGYDQLMATLKK